MPTGRRLALRLALGSSLLALAGGAKSAAAEGYSLFVDPNRTSDLFPAGMNDAAHVLATRCPADRECQPIAWNGKTGARRRIVAADQPEQADASAINDGDVVVGSYTADDDSHRSQRRPAMWDREGRRTDLGLLPGSQTIAHSDMATDINDHGVVTVNSSTTVNGRIVVHASIWRHGVLTDIDPHGAATRGPYRSYATAINNHDTVVGSRGYSGKDGDQFRAVRWDVDGTVELDTLFPGSRQHLDSAVDINDHGVIIGSCDDLAGSYQAVRWVGKGVTALPKVVDSDLSVEARSINNDGVIVGLARLAADPPSRAMMWDGDRAIDLNDLLDPRDRAVWTLLEAYAINNSGQIMGMARRPGGSWPYLFVMTPH